MQFKPVKLKLSLMGSIMVILMAIGSFVGSWAGWFPSRLVEDWYATGLFPLVSATMARVADAVGFSWLDLAILVAFPLVIYLVYRRKLLAVVGIAAGGYLFFFWSWGLNYHRQSLISKLEFDAGQVNPESIGELARDVAGELNRLYQQRDASDYDEERVAGAANERVRQVVEELDGTTWETSPRVKTSRLLNPFFKASGVEGMFNPFGHEALVTSGLLPFERPMILAHEIAHVRGYPNEGDANFVALMASVNSSDEALAYSGWLYLWVYLRSEEFDQLLDDGPRRDLFEMSLRRRRNRVAWISRAQTRTLDVFLKANRVEGGVRSYSRIVNLAVGTRDSWDRFSERQP